ncbi:hypothetical protein [Marilutibacter spongiae]|uniref:TonB C-terminal domain-containing protein n=1 Tax=Marilutibacter spongiae TaxID=2025720 RepID=A0A7W3Y6L5_9GAMM|nr:hypothetical protein [Lysobacter spongiae]MBB1061367.1 hypothetical protein [Lysobacter spongiae]
MKSHFAVVLAVIATCALPLRSHAQAVSPTPTEPCEAAYASLPVGSVLDLLDPHAPGDRRAAALAAYERLAGIEACPEFAYTLGQLYRHGSYLPGNLVPQDIERARELILPMAEDGYLPAFADLAEMEMRHANARAAMQWTQVYLHFVQTVQADYVEDVDALRFQRSAYNRHLLARTDFLWRRLTRPVLSRKLIAADLSAYLAAHEAAIAPRMRMRQEGALRRASAQDGGPARVTHVPDDCYVNAIRGVGSASASWIVEVLPTGERGRMVLENFVPNPAAAARMEACLARYEFAPFVGTRPATVRISMLLGSPEGGSLQRRR